MSDFYLSFQTQSRLEQYTQTGLVNLQYLFFRKINAFIKNLSIIIAGFIENVPAMTVFLSGFPVSEEIAQNHK